MGRTASGVRGISLKPNDEVIGMVKANDDMTILTITEPESKEDNNNDIKEPEKPIKIFEHIDKDKEFKSLKISDSKLFALYADGNKNYGFVVFQVE